MSLTSPYYWLAVAALAVLVAAAWRVVGQDRVELRVYRAALAFYLLVWLAIGTVTASPLFFGSLNVIPDGWPPLWAGLPLAIVVGVLAAAYDAEWQLQDRDRNRRFGTGPSL
jgi:hypothetical protein